MAWKAIHTNAAPAAPGLQAAVAPVVALRRLPTPLHALRSQQLSAPRRRGALCVASAADPAAPAPAQADTPAQTDKPVQAEKPEVTIQRRPQALTPAWQAAIDLLESGEIITTKVVSLNKSGVVVTIGKLNGFVPYKLMDRTALASVPRDNWTQELIGRDLTVKVTQVVVPERRLICSEKAAMLDRAAEAMQQGEVIEGRVVSLHEFGAFVEVMTAPYAGAEVMLPMRELSWDWVPNVNAKLSKGQELRVQVVDVKLPPRARVVVSLKRLQEDPLKETLDKVLPLEGGNEYADVGSVPASVPAAVEDILEELSREEGVSGVTLGRRVEERRTVSQDLELWISREVVQDGYNLVARAGRIVQEIHVTTALESGDMKAAVQRVLQRVS